MTRVSVVRPQKSTTPRASTQRPAVIKNDPPVVQAGTIGVAHLRNASPGRYIPAVPIHASELQATSVSEFLNLLRELLKRSGVNRKRIAERSGIPQSTVYHLLSPKTTTLPTKMVQVRMLAAACGLAPTEVERVSRLWIELRELPKIAAADTDAVGVDQAVEPPSDQHVVRPMLKKRRAMKLMKRSLPTQLLPMFFILVPILLSVMMMVMSEMSERGIIALPVVISVAAGMTAVYRSWTKPKVMVVEQHTLSDGTVRTLERYERSNGSFGYLDRTVDPEGRVSFSQCDE
ncbi:helix-turn-helix domain-containing protein [Umezawaea tangerina]|uniref:Helix-turn-helix protein n=1 Tax=Umezawaea tangerina TaxID=84725 RepID=A0A2T0SNT6_9PSEU|nr:helix-turn-helix transcriptional regulator [Umezawaea tangerina]PRY35088.1 hypothetical protein CLV43_1146 [Umezawaea tangerina]